MDLTILRKKISSYRTPAGRITNIPDSLLGEILHAWEQWSGTVGGFYTSLGVSQRKMAKLMGKAKQLKRDGAFDGLNFTEVVIEGDIQTNGGDNCSSSSGCNIELVYKNNIIRFGNSELLLDFLNRVRCFENEAA